MKKLPWIILLSQLSVIHADPWYCPRTFLYVNYKTPAYILKGIILTESDGIPSAIGDDGISYGASQQNKKYYGERAYWWGSYDPFYINDAIRITSCLFQANMKSLLKSEHMIDPSTWELKRQDIAIAAHRQGLEGAKHGMTYWYVKRVRSKGGFK